MTTQLLKEEVTRSREQYLNNMKNARKKITAIVLILMVLILAGVSVFITTQINTKKPIAPNAPASKPKAFDYLGGSGCNVAFSVDAPGLSCTKVTSNTETPAKDIATIAHSQEFIYKIKANNTGNTTLSDVTITDVLNGEHQDLLSFVSGNNGCAYSSTSKTVTCTIATIAASSSSEVSFKVKLAANAANGQVIKNKCKVKSGNLESECNSEITVSGTVTCNNACSKDDQCTNGLKCLSGMCRKEACSSETDCICPTSTATASATSRTTRPTTTSTRTATATATPANLPDTGVLNLPGAAAFGGGLLLTVLGILFAL